MSNESDHEDFFVLKQILYNCFESMEQILHQNQRFVIRVVYNPPWIHTILSPEKMITWHTQNDKIPLKYYDNLKKKKKKKYGHPSFLRVSPKKTRNFTKKLMTVFFMFVTFYKSAPTGTVPSQFQLFCCCCNFQPFLDISRHFKAFHSILSHFLPCWAISCHFLHIPVIYNPFKVFFVSNVQVITAIIAI